MKNNIQNKIKKLVFVTFIAVLFIPLVQQQFHLITEKPLLGFLKEEAFPEFSDSTLISGEFQEKFERAVTDNIGFHNSFVRTLNQLNYSIFNISKAPFVTIGKNNYLFGISYINGYNGDDFVGKDNINLQIQKAKVVALELSKKHIDLLFAFAPGKGSYFPEYIPDKYLGNKSMDSTNYSCYIRACSEAKLNFIDLRKYFLSIKDTVQHPLFSQVGVHWSDYAAFIAIDTIAKKIEQIKKTKTRPFYISRFEYLDTLKTQDRDIENLMNIYVTAPYKNMAYLKINFYPANSYKETKILTVADSYFEKIVHTNILDSVFPGSEFWLYNNYSISVSPEETFDFKSEIEKKDVVLLLATDATLGGFPYGFIDMAFEAYAPKDNNYYKIKNQELRFYVYDFFANVEKDKKWKNQFLVSAKKKGLSETEEIFISALWLYNNTHIHK